MHHLFVKFLLLLSAISLQAIIGCEIYHFVASDEPHALEGHVIKTISKLFVNLCWNDCVWLPWCFSINVRKTSEGSFECELSNSSKKANPNKMVTRQAGWSYHEMKGVNPELCKWYECKRKEDLGDGWRRYGDAAIKLFTEKKNWTEARSHCQSLGGDLLSITSSHENDFVNDVFVENLNLTYMQEDNGMPKKDFKHFKLNGEDPGVKLLGNQGDAVYKVDGREKALYFNGQKGYAELPAFSLQDDFTIAFWIKVLNTTESVVKPININTATKQRIYLVDISKDHFVHRFLTETSARKDFSRPMEKRNLWFHVAITWKKSEQRFQGASFGKLVHNFSDGTPASIDIKDSDIITLGANSAEYLNKGYLALHGYLKHLVFCRNKALSIEEIQTIMHWHEQGVWVGLNDLANTNQFSWSDGTHVKFKKLQDYSPQPTVSGRKCVAMAKEKKWLDKRCQLKYPFLCQKPAPP